MIRAGFATPQRFPRKNIGELVTNWIPHQ